LFCIWSGRWGHSLELLAKYYNGNADPRYVPAVTVYALAANLLLNSLNLFWAYKVMKNLDITNFNHDCSCEDLRL